MYTTHILLPPFVYPFIITYSTTNDISKFGLATGNYKLSESQSIDKINQQMIDMQQNETYSYPPPPEPVGDLDIWSYFPFTAPSRMPLDYRNDTSYRTAWYGKMSSDKKKISFTAYFFYFNEPKKPIIYHTSKFDAIRLE